MRDRFDFSVNLDDLAADAAAWEERAESFGEIRRIVDSECRLSATVFAGVPNGDGLSQRYEEFRLAVSDLLHGGEQKFTDIGERMRRTRAAYVTAEDRARRQTATQDGAGRRPWRESRDGQ